MLLADRRFLNQKNPRTPKHRRFEGMANRRAILMERVLRNPRLEEGGEPFFVFYYPYLRRS